MFKALCLVFLSYFIYTTYLLDKYEKLNDSMLRVNDTLLRSCVSGKVPTNELGKYR